MAKEKEAKVEVSKDDSNLKAALCYFPLFLINVLASLFFFFTEKDNKFLRFHALQSLILMVVLIVLVVPIALVSFVLLLIPVIGFILYALLWVLICVVFLGLDLFLMYKAYTGEKFMLPVLGAFAEKSA